MTLKALLRPQAGDSGGIGVPLRLNQPTWQSDC